MQFSHQKTQAANEYFHIGARSWAMGNANVALRDVFAGFNNQAGLARLKQTQAGFYGENRYLVPGLGVQAFSLAVPIKSGGVIGGTFRNFGLNDYRNQQYGLNYARSFGDKIDFGLQLNYFNTQVEGQNRQAISFEFGLMGKLSKDLTLGVHAYNPMQNKFNDFAQEKIPTFLRIGISYQTSKKVMANIEVEKDVLFPAQLKVGLEYQFNENIYARGGISTATRLNTFGLGFKFGKIIFDAATSVHPQLGLSPHGSLVYQFKSETKK